MSQVRNSCLKDNKFLTLYLYSDGRAIVNHWHDTDPECKKSVKLENMRDSTVEHSELLSENRLVLLTWHRQEHKSEIKVYDVHTGKQLHNLKRNKIDYIACSGDFVALYINGSLYNSSDSSDSLLLWNLKNNTVKDIPLPRLKDREAGVHSFDAMSSADNGSFFLVQTMLEDINTRTVLYHFSETQSLKEFYEFPVNTQFLSASCGFHSENTFYVLRHGISSNEVYNFYFPSLNETPKKETEKVNYCRMM